MQRHCGNRSGQSRNSVQLKVWMRTVARRQFASHSDAFAQSQDGRAAATAKLHAIRKEAFALADKRIGDNRLTAEETTRPMLRKDAATFWAWRRWGGRFSRIEFTILEIDEGDLFDEFVVVAAKLLFANPPERFGNQEETLDFIPQRGHGPVITVCRVSRNRFRPGRNIEAKERSRHGKQNANLGRVMPAYSLADRPRRKTPIKGRLR